VNHGRAGLPAQLQDASNRQANDDESNAAATKAGSAPRSCPPRAKWAFIQPRRTAKKASAVMQENEADRERRLRELASKLLFTIERRGSRFALYRDVDVPKPVGHDDLTLDEVEDILNTWKLRGPHGGWTTE
jgi:hypothetical protein